MTHETANVHYDTIEVDEYKEAQDEEISEPYYSEIAHNDSSDPRYIMKSNVCYNTLQASTVTNTMNSGHGESAMCISCQPSVKTPAALGTTAKRNQSPDYDDIH